MDRDERGNHHLHPRVRLDGAGDDVVAGDDHDPARQRDRADPDDSERSRRHQVRDLVSGVVQSELRRARRQHRRYSARHRCLWLVRYPDVDRGAGARCSHEGSVARLGQHPRQRGIRICDFLGDSGTDHSQGNGRNKNPRELVSAASPRWRGTASLVGNKKRWRARPYPERVAEASKGTWTVLVSIPGRANRQCRLLGDAQPQHSGFHPLRQESAFTSARPGAGATDDDDCFRFYRRGRDERYHRHFRPGDLGSGRSCQSDRTSACDHFCRARSSRGAAYDEHGG